MLLVSNWPQLCVSFLVRVRPTQSEPVGFPSCEIIRAVNGNTTALWHLLRLVFSKPEELSGISINGKTASVSIENVAVGVMPTSSRDNPLGASCGSEGQEC